MDRKGLSTRTYSPPSLSLAKAPDGDGEIIIEIDGRLALDAFQLRLQPERMASACSTMKQL